MTADKETIERVIAKARKLLSVEGRTPEEAAAYVAKAQSLLEQYDLTMESVASLAADKRTSIGYGGHVMATTEGKPDGWKGDIFEAVAKTSDCYTAYDYEYEETPSGRSRLVKRGKLIGFAHDVEMAGYELSFLIGEVQRLAKEYRDKREPK